MDDKENNLAKKILSESITSLLKNYTTLQEDSMQGKKLQEKIETLAEVQNQVDLGNEELIKKVIEKREKGIL